MKLKNFTLTGLLINCVLFFTSCSTGGVSPTVQAGNWQWKNASGSTNLANINTSTTINTAYDVITLRYQMLLGLTNTSSSNTGTANFAVYLQYLDAGLSSSASSSSSSTGWYTNSTYGVLPVDIQRYAGDNSFTEPFNRYSGGNYTVGETDQSTLNYSQTNGWHTLSDAGVSYSSTAADYTANKAAFTMSSSGSTITNGTINSGTYGANPSYTQLSTSPTYSYSSTISSTTTNGQIIYNSTNGNASGAYPITLSVNSNSSNYALSELEFHIKPSTILPINSSNTSTNIGILPGHRYFFRVRVAGKITAGSSTSIAYASVYGIGGGNYLGARNTTNKSSASSNPGLTIGDYKVNNAFPYLDVSSNLYATTLPVIYSKELWGTLNNSTINLSWTTSNEINNKYFSIQKSNDAKIWSEIGTIKSYFENGNGNGHSYSYLDESPFSGSNYYRLIQYDLDGNSHISNVIQINNNGISSFKLYPNPATNQITISGININDKLRILDLNGRVVNSIIVSSIPQNINISNLPSGIYILNIENKKSALKFIKK
ncbi:T9SS type A sorting domain-containing protein [Rhizosphaericola mali]|uniref:T9SS type A sorting domain-containing protein n=1 Tax=Rhizosphaericola mali TaxID=2545455 RepID=A0A5P2G3D1_9BACT|nr:T9SS type A sorting domain-containing protein [Rhizosphaericola mali]QES90334.1 T9SS type A sorting domain-containing protein [Rhizosphaericola mali]